VRKQHDRSIETEERDLRPEQAVHSLIHEEYLKIYSKPSLIRSNWGGSPGSMKQKVALQDKKRNLKQIIGNFIDISSAN
jgi:hypothetical protein